MRDMAPLLRVLVLVVLTPVAAFAQSSIGGLVKDTSGAVLPGVTVEAASPVLIEKARTAISDSAGQYRITDLQPGTYTITFTLTGFTTIKRENVELTGSGVTTINADMRVGAVTETIVVSGETPVVDIRTTRRQEVLTNDVIQTLPATRGYNGILAMIPSVMTLMMPPVERPYSAW